VKAFLNVIGVMLILAGSVFFLQGINILPGSFMTGDLRWAITGGIGVVIGVALMFWASRRS
jgi:hypothetical protein